MEGFEKLNDKEIQEAALRHDDPPEIHGDRGETPTLDLENTGSIYRSATNALQAEAARDPRLETWLHSQLQESEIGKELQKVLSDPKYDSPNANEVLVLALDLLSEAKGLDPDNLPFPEAEAGTEAVEPAFAPIPEPRPETGEGTLAPEAARPLSNVERDALDVYALRQALKDLAEKLSAAPDQDWNHTKALQELYRLFSDPTRSYDRAELEQVQRELEGSLGTDIEPVTPPADPEVARNIIEKEQLVQTLQKLQQQLAELSEKQFDTLESDIEALTLSLDAWGPELTQLVDRLRTYKEMEPEELRDLLEELQQELEAKTPSS